MTPAHIRRQRHLRRLEEVSAFYEHGYKMREIADALGVTKQRASQLVDMAEAEGKLKKRPKPKDVLAEQAPALVARGLNCQQIANRLGLKYNTVVAASKTYLAHLDWNVAPYQRVAGVSCSCGKPAFAHYRGGEPLCAPCYQKRHQKARV